MDYKYPKSEKLCSRLLFEKLVKENQHFYVFPLKVYWLETELPNNVAVQSAVTVPKRKFKLAVSRNLLKRRMRESFRLNKHKLYSTLSADNKQIAMLIIYNHTKILKYRSIEKAIKLAFEKIVKSL